MAIRPDVGEGPARWELECRAGRRGRPQLQVKGIVGRAEGGARKD